MNPRGSDLFGQKVHSGIEAIPPSIDINPVMCSAEKCVVADSRIMLPEVKGSTDIWARKNFKGDVIINWKNKKRYKHQQEKNEELLVEK